jgi:hypothetical protein
MIVAAESPDKVALSPGTIERPVAPGTLGLAAALVTPAPGPATIFADGEADAADEEFDMSVHAPSPSANPNAVNVAANLFMTVLPFDQPSGSVGAIIDVSRVRGPHLRGS